MGAGRASLCRAQEAGKAAEAPGGCGRCQPQCPLAAPHAHLLQQDQGVSYYATFSGLVNAGCSRACADCSLFDCSLWLPVADSTTYSAFGKVQNWHDKFACCRLCAWSMLEAVTV